MTALDFFLQNAPLMKERFVREKAISLVKMLIANGWERDKSRDVKDEVKNIAALTKEKECVWIGKFIYKSEERFYLGIEDAETIRGTKESLKRCWLHTEKWKEIQQLKKEKQTY